MQIVSQESAAVILDPLAPISAKFFHWFNALLDDDMSDEERLKVLDLDSETILVELELALGRSLTSLSRAKVILGHLAYTTDRFEGDPQAFIEFANYATSQSPPAPGIFEPANAIECAAAVTELAIINSDLTGKLDIDDLEFSEEIRKYWGAILASEGLFTTFAPLHKAIMPPLPEIDNPEVFAAVDDTSRRVRIEFQNEARAGVLRSLQLISTIKGLDGQPVIDHSKIVELLPF